MGDKISVTYADDDGRSTTVDIGDGRVPVSVSRGTPLSRAFPVGEVEFGKVAECGQSIAQEAGQDWGFVDIYADAVGAVVYQWSLETTPDWAKRGDGYLTESPRDRWRLG
ncbi:hypothetical protein [Tessaracoccus massiliensis]|uniref:hypothetical protein n=1 Tax=Tessaracoccus massiliensis TaxID=1522311 RepID=UPI00058B0DD4|nr:hypothetical protein [Tessaracoccus massiliensis]